MAITRDDIACRLEDALFLDPPEIFDKCIVGLAERAGGMSAVAYDRDKCIKALMAQNKWDRDEAVEWFEFNTASAFIGDRTPVFIDTDF